MTFTFSEGSKICDERDQQLHFETETFALWSQNLRLILILLKSISNIETDTETFDRWSQSLRPALRSPWSQSQSRDQSLTHLCQFESMIQLISCFYDKYVWQHLPFLLFRILIACIFQLLSDSPPDQHYDILWAFFFYKVFLYY